MDAIQDLEQQFSTMFPDVSDEVAQNTHPKDVFEWRRAEFQKIGFKRATADWLAKTRIELRKMEKLISAGCPQDLAIRIMVGTTFAGEDEGSQLRKAVVDEESAEG